MKPASKVQSLARRQLKNLKKVIDTFGETVGFASGGVVKLPDNSPLTGEQGCYTDTKSDKIPEPQVVVNITHSDMDPKVREDIKNILDKLFKGKPP